MPAPRIQPDEIRVGVLVSYEDMANPRRKAWVVGLNDNPWSRFELRWVDDGRESTSDLAQPGWRLEDAQPDLRRARLAGRAEQIAAERAAGMDV